MSLVHRGWDSDVYVYLSDDGYYCDSCFLDPKCVSLLVETPEEMVAHLEEHRAKGHKFPDRVIEELKKRFK